LYFKYKMPRLRFNSLHPPLKYTRDRPPRRRMR